MLTRARAGAGIGGLAKRTIQGFHEDDMGTYAAALAYNTLFAIFPFAIFLVALLGFLRVPGLFDLVLDQARVMLPDQAAGQVIDQVRDRRRGGPLSLGILAALWFASAGVRSLMNALDVAYRVPTRRPAREFYPLSILYTIGLAAMVIVATVLMLIGPQAAEWLADRVGLAREVVWAWAWLRLPAATGLLMLAVAIAYHALPNTKQPFRLVTPGSVLSVLVWVAASAGFSSYVSNLSRYGATYGSLGAVVALLFYLFISSAVLLMGAELNAQVYRARGGEEPGERDSSLWGPVGGGLSPGAR